MGPFVIFHWTAVTVAVLFFIYSSFTDIMRLEVPVQYCPYIYLAAMVDIVLNQPLLPAISRVFAAVFLFSIFFLMARCGQTGGGDALAIPVIALLHGLPFTLLVLLEACVITLIWVIVSFAFTKRKPRPCAAYPLMPGVAIAYCFMLGAQIV